MSEKAVQILAALGGKENVVSLESCITRLRIELKDPSKLNDKVLKAQGAVGVMKMGKAVQVVLGTTAEQVETEIKKLL